MPYNIRTEEQIAADVIRDIAATSIGRISDANVMAIMRTIVEEGIAPEMAQEYFSGVEILESALINKAQGTDLDLKIEDWKFADAEEVIERDEAAAATGFATYFTTELDKGTASSGGPSVLNDTSKSFIVNAFAGKMLRLTSGIGAGQVANILSNTATQIVIDDPGVWVTQPIAGTTYAIHDPAAADVTVPVGSRSFAQGPDLDTRFRFKTTVAPSTPTSSVATGGTSGANPTLIDTAQAWTDNAERGRMVIIRSGTGANQIGVVVSNTPTVLTLKPLFPDVTSWATAPDGTSVYDVLEATIPDGGCMAPVPVEALSTGSDHNIALYSLVNFEDQPPNTGGIWNTDAETTPATFVNGADIERDPDYRERFRRKLQLLTRGTKPAIIQGLLDIEDSLGANPIQSAAIDESVYPAIAYIDDGSGGASAPLLARSQARIDGTGEFSDLHPLRSSGFLHTATAAAGLIVDVVVAIAAIRAGFAYLEVRDEIEQRIVSLFDSLGIGDDVIYFQFLSAAVASGVLDLTTPTIAGGTVNVVVAANQKAILGTTSIS